ncbi:MAG: hypothetical protein P4L43_03110 [Syntrophobacteraceae bacterium]|nr:hypothetical protein [Syntrophobacteraceae bacterium]
MKSCSSAQGLEWLRARGPKRPAAMGLAIRLGVVHALVDAACAALVYAEVARGRLPFDTLVLLVFVYNSLAFGTQWLIGLIADISGAYRLTAAAGTLLVAAAAVVEPSSAFAGVVVAGIGNACFHVGAGAVVLRKSFGRGAESGIFVGPGALGLVAGLWLGLHSNLWRLPSIILLLGASLLFPRLLPALGQEAPMRDAAPVPPRAAALLAAFAVILLLFCSVAVRSAVGGLLSGSWRTSTFAPFGLGAAAMAGKWLGGIVSDRFGWRLTTILALLVSAPLLAAGLTNLGLALGGMFLFQFTMPVTLAAIYLAFPRWPGLSFGLPCLALLLGALPGLTGLLQPAAFKPFAVPLVLLSALMLFAGLGEGPRGAKNRAEIALGKPRATTDDGER